MSFYNPTKNPFPFYRLEGTIWTNYKPEWYRNNCNHPYIHSISPGLRYFQLPIDNNIMSQVEISAVNLRSAGSNTVVPADISRTIYVEGGENKILVVALNVTLAMVSDKYYISVETVHGFYYSETFCVKGHDKNTVQVEWASTTRKVGRLIYPDQVKQSINLKSHIVMAEPTIEEETEENGYGEETAVLQILTQPYFLSAIVPNFLAEALSALKMHDLVIINNRKVGDNQIDFDDETKIIDVKVTPEADSCESFLEISYVKQSVTKTGCEGEIRALNNAPFADIVWADTKTTEQRECNVNDVCSITIESTEYTTDVDGETLTLQWQRSSDDGTSWANVGNGGDQFQITESAEGNYQYRLIATDPHGLFGISNALKYTLFDISKITKIVDVVRATSKCDSNGGELMARRFNLIGNEGTYVRFRMTITQNYGHGFIVELYNSNAPSPFWTQSSGPVGSVYYGQMPVYLYGTSNYLLDICLRPCLNTDVSIGGILIELYETDNITLSGEKIALQRSISCR